MEMRRLEAFCKVVELRSFTKAADALSLSQPTISEHIRMLEESLDEKLIDRLGRETQATPAGRVFYQYAANILELRNEGVRALAQFKEHLSGQLLVGAGTTPGAYFLPQVVGEFKARYPEIMITLKISDTMSVSQQVIVGDLEAGLVGSKLQDRRLLVEELYLDELVVAVYPEHPWAERGQIELNDLTGAPFILREPGSGTRMVMTRILEENGFDTTSLSPVAEMSGAEAVKESIKAKIGVSILSKKAIIEAVNHGAMKFVTIRNVAMLRPIYLIERKNKRNSPLCDAFLEYLKSTIVRS